MEPIENIIAIRSRDIGEANAAFADFMQKTENCFNERSKKDPKLYKDIQAEKLESLTVDLLKEIAPSTPFKANEIKLISGIRFPDIVAEKYFGVEVKSTQSNKWTSIGGSIVESTRVEDVDNIYMLFGKLGGTPPEFRCRPYQDCLYDIAVTHSPRYLIDMNLASGDSIFTKMGKEYNSFWKMPENDKFDEVRKYYLKKAKNEGRYEMPWWMSGTTNVNLSFYSDTDVAHKETLLIRAYALFFTMYDDNTQIRFKQVSLWLCTHYSLLCPNMRDLFTAGGIYEYNTGSGVKKAPHIVGELLKRVVNIKELLDNPDNDLAKDIEDFWDFSYNPSRLYESWLANIEVTFSKSKFLKDVPIRKLIDETISSSTISKA